MENLNQNKLKPSLSKEQLIKLAESNPNINKSRWGKITVEALKKSTTKKK